VNEVKKVVLAIRGIGYIGNCEMADRDLWVRVVCSLPISARRRSCRDSGKRRSKPGREDIHRRSPEEFAGISFFRPAGECDYEGPIFWDLSRQTTDRQAAARDCQAGRRRCGLPRGHGKGNDQFGLS